MNRFGESHRLANYWMIERNGIRRGMRTLSSPSPSSGDGPPLERNRKLTSKPLRANGTMMPLRVPYRISHSLTIRIRFVLFLCFLLRSKYHRIPFESSRRLESKAKYPVFDIFQKNPPREAFSRRQSTIFSSCNQSTHLQTIRQTHKQTNIKKWLWHLYGRSRTCRPASNRRGIRCESINLSNDLATNTLRSSYTLNGARQWIGDWQTIRNCGLNAKNSTLAVARLHYMKRRPRRTPVRCHCLQIDVLSDP